MRRKESFNDHRTGQSPEVDKRPVVLLLLSRSEEKVKNGKSMTHISQRDRTDRVVQGSE